MRFCAIICYIPIVARLFETPRDDLDLQGLTVSHPFSQDVWFCRMMNKINHGNYDTKQKAELTKGIIPRQLGHLCLLRPVAFRPPLAKGLALSRTT